MGSSVHVTYEAGRSEDRGSTKECGLGASLEVSLRSLHLSQRRFSSQMAISIRDSRSVTGARAANSSLISSDSAQLKATVHPTLHS